MVEIIFLGKLKTAMGANSIKFSMPKSLSTKQSLIAYIAGTDTLKTEALSGPNVKMIVDNKDVCEDFLPDSVQFIAFAPPMIGG